MLNLCVIDARSSCSLCRTARGGAFISSGSGGAAAPGRRSSLLEFAVFVPAADRGCDFLQPSRYTATALRPSFHACRYASMMSSTDAFSGRLTVFDIAPEINGCAAAIIRRCPMYAIDRVPLAGLKEQSKTAR